MCPICGNVASTSRGLSHTDVKCDQCGVFAIGDVALAELQKAGESAIKRWQDFLHNRSSNAEKMAIRIASSNDPLHNVDPGFEYIRVFDI